MMYCFHWQYVNSRLPKANRHRHGDWQLLVGKVMGVDPSCRRPYLRRAFFSPPLDIAIRALLTLHAKSVAPKACRFESLPLAPRESEGSTVDRLGLTVLIARRDVKFVTFKG